MASRESEEQRRLPASPFASHRPSCRGPLPTATSYPVIHLPPPAGSYPPTNLDSRFPMPGLQGSAAGVLRGPTGGTPVLRAGPKEGHPCNPKAQPKGGKPKGGTPKAQRRDTHKGAPTKRRTPTPKDGHPCNPKAHAKGGTPMQRDKGGTPTKEHKGGTPTPKRRTAMQPKGPTQRRDTHATTAMVWRYPGHAAPPQPPDSLHDPAGSIVDNHRQPLSDATGIGRGNPALNFLRVSPTVMGLNRGDGDRSGESRLFCSNLGGQITAFWIQRR